MNGPIGARLLATPGNAKRTVRHAHVYGAGRGMNLSTGMELERLRVRRIVTGHDERGKAVVVEDEQLAGTALAEDGGRMDASFFHLWATHEMPVDLSDEAAMRQREGSGTTVLGTGQGSVLRLGVLAAGVRSPMHRTESLDYGICLAGECDLELDSGAVVTVRAGDVVIQRGTNHVWHNRTERPCWFAWILLDAKPLTIAGQRLASSWVHEQSE